ncbi:DUF202 domain-containing protein [Colletotrichum higginsianum]|nr:DUF202 domain-containing protein [Colletotrichum higginsianum]
MASRTDLDDEDLTFHCCAPLRASELLRPVEVGEIGGPGHAGKSTFFAWPILGPLLFENATSDARDHCANERTFLSYLRLSVYMSIVAVAIVLSFHLNRKAAIVQTGWRTQLVLSIVALSIVGTCAVLLVIAKITANAQKGESSHAAVYAAGHVLK